MQSKVENIVIVIALLILVIIAIGLVYGNDTLLWISNQFGTIGNNFIYGVVVLSYAFILLPVALFFGAIIATIAGCFYLWSTLTTRHKMAMAEILAIEYKTSKPLVIEHGAMGQVPIIEQPKPIELLPDSRIDLLPVLDNALSFAMACEKGAGKTSILKRKADMEIGKGSKVIVLDTQASLNTWPNRCEVLTNRHRIFNRVNQLVMLYSERTKQINNNVEGTATFQRLVLLIDEMTDLTSLMSKEQLTEFSTAIKTLLNGRKQAIGVGIAGHSINANNIGLKGNADLIKNFDLLIDISVNQHKERTFRANTKPSTANKWSVTDWSLCYPVPAYTTNYEPRNNEINLDYPATFQPTVPTMSLNRTMSQHDKLLLALKTAYPNGELPEKKADIHKTIGLKQAGNNVTAINRAIEAYNMQSN